MAALKLLSNSSETLLKEDIVVKSSSALFFDGAGQTLTTAQHQFKVEAGAKLCLYNLNLIDGKVCHFLPNNFILMSSNLLGDLL